MKLLAVASALCLATPVFPQYTVFYDTLYDGAQNTLSSVACSTGEYGLIAMGYNTFGQLPSYPFIGGGPQVQSWDSPSCGTCWELTYIDRNGVSSSTNFTIINSSGQEGFVVSLAGLNYLTSGNELDGAPITAVQVAESSCDM